MDANAAGCRLLTSKSRHSGIFVLMFILSVRITESLEKKGEKISDDFLVETLSCTIGIYYPCDCGCVLVLIRICVGSVCRLGDDSSSVVINSPDCGQMTSG